MLRKLLQHRVFFLIIIVIIIVVVVIVVMMVVMFLLLFVVVDYLFVAPSWPGLGGWRGWTRGQPLLLLLLHYRLWMRKATCLMEYSFQCFGSGVFSPDPYQAKSERADK